MAKSGTKTSVGRPPSSGAAGTRDALIDGAIAALKEEGFAGASARAIARRAGCNQGVIFYHFGSVANLLLAALDAVSETRRTHYQEAVDRAAGDRRARRCRGVRLRGGPRRRSYRRAGRDDRRCQLDAGARGRGRGPDRARGAPSRRTHCAVSSRRRRWRAPSSPTSPRTRSSRCIWVSRCWRTSTGTGRRRWRCSTGPASWRASSRCSHHTWRNDDARRTVAGEKRSGRRTFPTVDSTSSPGPSAIRAPPSRVIWSCRAGGYARSRGIRNARRGRRRGRVPPRLRRRARPDLVARGRDHAVQHLLDPLSPRRSRSRPGRGQPAYALPRGAPGGRRADRPRVHHASEHLVPVWLLSREGRGRARAWPRSACPTRSCGRPSSSAATGC